MNGEAQVFVRDRLDRNAAFSTLLVLFPFFVVCLLLRFFLLAALCPAIGLVLLVLVRPVQRRRPDWMLIGFATAGCLLVLFLILPVVNLLLTTDPSRIVAIAQDKSVEAALGVTLGTAMVATLIALAAGIPLGYVLAREVFPGKAMVEGIVDMPVVVPHTIAGIALLFIFGRAGVIGAPAHSRLGVQIGDSRWGIVVAMLFVSIPFVVNLARDGFTSVDPRMEYVARSLGAGPLGAFLRVTMPLTWRALLSGAIMAWARAISEFGSIAVIAYYPKTINTLLFEWYNFFGYTYTKPLAALLLIVSLAIFITLRSVARTRRTVQNQSEA